MIQKSLQETYAPDDICYGCGQANEKGFRLRSYLSDDGETVVAEWQPQAHHQAFSGVLNGGVIGTLIDCHSNWTAAHHLMKQNNLDHAPTTVTANYTVKLRMPTPTDSPVKLVARVVESTAERATVESELIADGEITATGRATFVAVRADHPAFAHRQ